MADPRWWTDPGWRPEGELRPEGEWRPEGERRPKGEWRRDGERWFEGEWHRDGERWPREGGRDDRIARIHDTVFERFARRDILEPWDKYPDATLDYLIPFRRAIDPAEDLLAMATLQAAPSGAGELALSNLTVKGEAVIFTASGGQPRRIYTLKLVLAMTNARVFTFLGEMRIPPTIERDRAAPAAWSGFGPPLVWTFAPSLDFTQPRNAGLRLMGWC